MNRFGIVDTDNFGGDYPNEKFIVSCWLSRAAAEQIAEILNHQSGAGSNRFYKVVSYGYKLSPGFEP